MLKESAKTYLSPDSAWTKEETDSLFDLCQRFDQRFVIIADKFPFPDKKLEVRHSINFVC